MKKIIIIAFIMFLSIPHLSSAQSVNVGIIEGLWFSEAPFFEGENIRIYTAVQNNSGQDVTGIVEFFENDNLLGVKGFDTGNNTIEELFIDTIAIAGKRSFSVQVTEIQQTSTGENELLESESVFYEKEVLVKKDFDGDNISDDEDKDDDNDGYSDIQEKKEGSDPFDPDDIPKKIVEEDPKQNTLEIMDRIQDIFNSDTTVVNPMLEKEIIERIPESVLSVTQDKPFLYRVSKGITGLQYKVEQAINERLHAKENSVDGNKESLVGVGIGNDGLEVSVNTDAGASKAGIGLLQVLQKIVSFWWVFPILIFVVIGLLLKILFKIFGRRSR